MKVVWLFALIMLGFTANVGHAVADAGGGGGGGEPTVLDVEGAQGAQGADGNGQFRNELGFITTIMESNYMLFISLLLGIWGFWTFIVHGKGFGIIIILLALGLTAFPGIFKGFYQGTRPFVDAAVEAPTTLWQ